MDVFNQAGRLWNRLIESPRTPFFDVTLASADGEPIRSVNNINILPHCSIEDIRHTDLILISSATYIAEIMEKTPELVPWIRYHHDRGAHVASICTGVFLLAETGLLDGKSATLHWGFADEFRKRYPQIELRQDRMFIDHGSVYCSAGVTAGMDLSLYLVEKFCGRQVAVEVCQDHGAGYGESVADSLRAFVVSQKPWRSSRRESTGMDRAASIGAD